VVASLRLIVIAAVTLSAGGCAVGNMGSMFGAKSGDGTQALALDESTGTAGLRGVAGRTGAAETDLVFARMAIIDVLSRGSKDVSAPWENPSSGARGTVTPIANAYMRDGGTCHDFLASYVLQGTEAWYQGEACRPHRGKWEVKSLRPWTRT
jgi:surface antigen